ncbi:hypothetical protein KC887_00400 [Candidatus Kaiserbacteria bacterium]|nr:hypothetical protein [Candidatus Kaiserbacteria bacterium]
MNKREIKKLFRQMELAGKQCDQAIDEYWKAECVKEGAAQEYSNARAELADAILNYGEIVINGVRYFVEDGELRQKEVKVI